MITDLIREDHLAARDMLAVIGNTTHPAFAERADAFARLARLWAVHGNMMADAVHPLLGTTRAWPDPVAASMELNQEVETLATDLAAREGVDDERLRGEYEHLRGTFERQVEVEEVDLIPMLMTLPPEKIAAATAAATRSRSGG